MLSAVYISGMVLYAAIFKKDDDSGNVLMGLARRLFNYLYCLPGALLAALFYLVAHLSGLRPYFAAECFAFAVGSLVSVYMIMLLSEKLFKRLEYLS